MDLFQHVTPETTVLTPNRRLSAILLKKYSSWQTEAKQTCWTTLDVLPLYPSWLERMWKTYAASNILENHMLLTTHQEQILWEKILREAPENEFLLQITDTAKLAKSAWEILKRWRVNLNNPSLELTDDSRAFLQWANQFQQKIQQHNWLDHPSLADMLANKIADNEIIPPDKIILIGFAEIAPQYQHLLKICEQHNSQLEYYEMPNRNQITYSIGLSDTETEIRTMARWAKNLVDKSSSIACIIPNLETLREMTSRIFSDIFGEIPFNISAGKTLTSYPVIHDALQLLQLNKKNISLTALSSVLRSPFIGEAEREKFKRAIFDNRLRNSNILTIPLQQLLDPHEKHNLFNTCPGLGKRVKQFLEKCHQHKNDILPINQWVKIFSDILTIFGWPGERSLNSHEYQVIRNSWLSLLSEYAAFDTILEPQPYHKALHYLTCLAASTVFQPESPEASVQILGLLEAADLPFEYSWTIGLDDTSWPSRPKPNPFIPLRLQKLLQMPNASAERELIYCQTLTTQIQRSAHQAFFSYPLQRDDATLRPSSLLKTFNEMTLEQLNLPIYISTTEKIYLSKQLEYLADDIAPAISSEEQIQGGVKIFKTQAECPFKAFAELRLHAKKIEDATLGLRKLDRGNMVHKALELIWKELRDSNSLNMKSTAELQQLIHECASQALAATVETASNNNKRYLTLELKRLEKLLWNWLQIEKTRPPFSVLALEQEISATIGNITATFRIDRVDELTCEYSDTKQLIIDYKTGKEINKNNWFGDRLDEPQLPIYCIAHPHNTVGIAFAKVNPAEMTMIGTSKHPVKMDTITPLTDIAKADASLWQEQMHIWQANLEKLGNDFYQGKAHVDPKDAQTCRLCTLQPFCRIHESTDNDETYDNTDTA